MRDRIHKLSDVARMLRVEESDVRMEIEAGRLRAVTIGSRNRIAESDLNAYLWVLNINPAIRRFPGARFLIAAAIISVSTCLTAATSEFPFPEWQHQQTPPEKTLFKDQDVIGAGDPERFPPVNAPLDYRRFNEAGNPGGIAFTHSLMSLQHQNNLAPGSFSFPWTLFINLDTNHDRGDGVASYLRLHNRRDGWATGSHVDAIAHGQGTTLGTNVETIDRYGDAFIVGMNVQNKGFIGDVGMQIQTGPLPRSHPWWQPGMNGGWETGIRLAGHSRSGHYGTGIELGRRTTGNRGLWIRGDFNTGIDLGGNDLRMAAGSRLELSYDGTVAMRYNAHRGHIQFLNGEEVIAFLDIEARDRGLTD